MDPETTTPASDAPPRFHRTLSGFGVIILTLSVLSPGVSIFVSGGTIIQQAGSGAILAFLLGGAINYFQTSMTAELGSAYPTAGYDYAAIGHAIGDWAGATTYVASLVSLPLFLNTSAVGIAIYLRPLFPGLEDDAVTYATIFVVTFLAMLNIRSNERITGLFLLIEVLALLLVAVLGAAHVQPGVHELMAHPVTVRNGGWVGVGLGAMALASTSASWAIAGSNQALFFSEDMRHPSTVGRIMILSFLATVFLETAPVAGTIVGSHDLKQVLGASAPFEEFLKQYLPAFGMKFISLSIAVAIFNATLAGFIGIGRNVFSMGRTALFHPRLNRLLMHLISRTDAPWVALLLIGGVTALATLLSMKIKIMMLAGNLTFMTMFYLWGCISGRRSGRTRDAAYRTPLYPLVPVVGIFIVAGEVTAQWLDRDVGRPSLVLWLGIFTASYLYYRFVLLRRPRGWRMAGPVDVDTHTVE
ncbi:MAG TPA: APC family permease [Steroidobacteraceae bacterium]|nr:APC family permease [Steroidobacteraceae bacterium]